MGTAILNFGQINFERAPIAIVSMPFHKPSPKLGSQSSQSTVSTTASEEELSVSCTVHLLRALLGVILALFVLPVSLLLTPWWIWMQPFEGLCPTMMDGYYRIVTWPLTMAKNVRSYRNTDRFVDRMKY